MSSLNMTGPYKLDAETIDNQVTKTSPGNYALGKKNDEGTFLVNYVGRSDSDVNRRLKDWIGETSLSLQVQLCHLFKGSVRERVHQLPRPRITHE